MLSLHLVVMNEFYQSFMLGNITSYDITNCSKELNRDCICMTKGSKPDREYIQKDMKPVEEYLLENNVQKPKKLIQAIHKKKVQKTGQINLMTGLPQYIENVKKTKVYQMKKRNLNIININERNLLMNFYAHQYPDETKSFLNEQLPKILQDKDDAQDLIQKLEKKIDKLSNQFLDYIFQLDFQYLLNQEEEDSLDYIFQLDFEYIDDPFDYLPNQEEDYSNYFNNLFL